MEEKERGEGERRRPNKLRNASSKRLKPPDKKAIWKIKDLLVASSIETEEKDQTVRREPETNHFSKPLELTYVQQ